MLFTGRISLYCSYARVLGYHDCFQFTLTALAGIHKGDLPR